MNNCNCAEVFEKTLPCWDKLTPAQRDLLCADTFETTYQKGQNVHGSSGECTGAVFVRSGSLRAYMLSEDGREITLYRLFAGDMCMLSASCVLSAITFDVFMDADEDSDCFVINPVTLSRIIDENVYVENFALSTAVERFSDVMWSMQQLLFMSFDKRLAIFLLDELSKSGDDTVWLTQEQIARYIGSAREVVSRMLKYFAGEKLVEVLRGGVRIIDKKRLAQLTR